LTTIGSTMTFLTDAKIIHCMQLEDGWVNDGTKIVNLSIQNKKKTCGRGLI
jgi:hypothetical protein